MPIPVATIPKMRGDTWTISVEITGVDISTATFAAQARLDPDDEIAHDFVCTVSGQIVTCTLDAATTSGMEGPAYVWDLQMTREGQVTTVSRALIPVTKDVTRV